MYKRMKTRSPGMAISTGFYIAITLFQSIVLGTDEGCGGKPADIAFVLDTSSSIYAEDYEKQLQFVQEIVGIFEIGADKMRVAAITFSDDAHPQFDLGTHTNKTTLQDAIRKVPYYGGGTHTDRALKYLRKVVLSADNARPGVPRIGIILTDGLSNEPDLTKEEAFLAREEGIILFVVGIGWGVDEGELDSIGSEPKSNFVLQIDDFLDLSSIKDKLAIKACKAEEQLKSVESEGNENLAVIAEACGGKPADVVFALDTSSSILMEDYDKQLQFVKDVVDMFDVAQEKTRIGLLTFSDQAYPQFSLTDFNSKPELQKAIMAVEYTGGSTFTNLALEFMREVAFQPSVDRPEAVKIGIVLTDGMSHTTRKTLEQAALTKRWITLFVIGIGSEVDGAELDGIASEPVTDHRFTTDNFDALQSIKNALAIKACAVETKQQTLAEQPVSDNCFAMAPTDMVFGIDSARFGDTGTWTILKFVNNLVSSFEVGSETTRLALVSTDCTRGSPITLSKHFSKTAFQHDLLEFETNDLDDLVQKVRISGFSTQNGGRDGVDKKAVLFITGELKNQDNLSAQLKRAEFAGIRIYVVGIGARLDKTVLIDLFGDDFVKFYLPVDNLVELDQVREILTEMICPFSPGPGRIY